VLGALRAGTRTDRLTGTTFNAHIGDRPIAGLIRVVDGGAPNSGADSFEFAFQVGPQFDPPLPGPTSCSSFPGSFPRDLTSFPDFSNKTGDVVVADARALPTSKDQCKNGGWRQYGFKNQGICVAFVIHQAIKACVSERDAIAILRCVKQHVDPTRL
jgi:hypothetical protein